MQPDLKREDLKLVFEGEPGVEEVWEWEFVQHANLGAYDVAVFSSNDRGGKGIFVRHP